MQVRRQLGDRQGAEEALQEGLAQLEGVGTRRGRPPAMRAAAVGAHAGANAVLLRGGMLASLSRVLIDGGDFARAEGAIRLGMQEVRACAGEAWRRCCVVFAASCSVELCGCC